MEFRSSDHISYLSLVPVERGHENLPSVSLAVEARVGELLGACASVWVELDAIQVFQDELKALETSRNGSAHLSAMSPGAFELSLETYDLSGHLRLRVELAKARYVGHVLAETRLSGAFEVDSEQLLNIVAAASSLHQP